MKIAPITNLLKADLLGAVLKVDSALAKSAASTRSPPFKDLASRHLHFVTGMLARKVKELGGQELLPSEPRAAPAQGHRELVLVVDDEESIVEVTKAVLERNNYCVLSASDGVEAVALFGQQIEAIKLVLTDIAMPNMDGLAAARALRKMKFDIPIIVFTGDAQQERIKEFQAMNIQSFLSKPFSRENLLAAVHTSIGTGRLGQR